MVATEYNNVSIIGLLCLSEKKKKKTLMQHFSIIAEPAQWTFLKLDICCSISIIS